MSDPVSSSPRVLGGLVVWEGVFTQSELDGMEQYGDQLVRQKAQIASPSSNDDVIRVTQIAWIERNARSAGIYDRITEIVRVLNSRLYKFQISGLENLQYTVYHAAEQGHYDWHLDYGGHNRAPRKLSLSIQVSDPSHYDGCELQLRTGPTIDTAPKGRGTVIAFPSFFLHRVTPIVAGTRKALVVWATGPQFR